MSKKELLEYLIDLTYKVECLISQASSMYDGYLKNYTADNLNQDSKSENEIFISINSDTIKEILQPKIKEIVSSCKESVELIPQDCQEKFYANILRISVQKISDFMPELEKDFNSYECYINVVLFFLVTLYGLYNSIADYLNADINKQNISREKTRIRINKAYKSFQDLKFYKFICSDFITEYITRKEQNQN